jgi:hypothetical protein
MGLSGYYIDPWSIEAQNSDQNSVTSDFETDIIPFANANSMLTAFSHTDGSESIVTSGIIEYTTRNPNTGIDDPPVNVGSLHSFKQQNSVGAFNVVRVTFGASAKDSGGGGSFATRGDGVNQVWLWEL